LNFGDEQEATALSDLHFIKLTLKDRKGALLSENFYWRNGRKELDYTSLASLPKAKLEFDYKNVAGSEGIMLRIVNRGESVSFGNRLRLVDAATNERILPLMISDNYFTLMPGEEKVVRLTESHAEQLKNAKLLWKQYGHAEKETLKLKNIF
ncbi:glycoside hydrolase family 2 protein, partial [Sphingobacterium multivorum]